MRILKPGSLEPLPNWISLKLHCSKCNGEFETENGDIPCGEERSMTGSRWYKCPTPNCGNEIKASYLDAIANSQLKRLENARGEAALAEQTREFCRG